MSLEVAGSEGVDPTATLIVTRPEPEAGRLVDALISQGRHAWALPVLAIEDAGDIAAARQALATVDRYALVVFVSPNAIRRALALRDASWPTDVTIGVMGPGSVATLASHGIAAPGHRVIAPPRASTIERAGDRFDSEALFDALDATLGLTTAFTGRVLIVRGNGGRAWFGDRLRDLGIAVDEVEAYRRVRPVADAEQVEALRRAFGEAVPPVFIVTSSEGVGHLVAIVEEALADFATPTAVRTWLFASTVVAPHRRIAAKATEAGFRRVVTTASGDRGIASALARDPAH